MSSSNNLADEIRTLLEKTTEGFTARQLSKHLNVDRSSVNKVLYAGLGRVFVADEAKAPTWRSIDNLRVAEESVSRSYTLENMTGEIHLDLPGGDWKIQIGVSKKSVNDALAEIETRGHREALIDVSDVFQTNHNGPGPSAATIAISAAVIANHVRDELLSDGVRPPTFDAILKDVFLSLRAHSSVVDEPAD